MPPSHHTLTAPSFQLSAGHSNLRRCSHTPTDAGLWFFMIFKTSSPSEQCLPTPTQQDAALSFLIWWGFWTGVGCTFVTLSAKCRSGKRSVQWFDFLQFVTRPQALSCEQDYHHDHSDVPRHDRFHSCHSCGYPPRRCLFSKHITSLNIGGGRDGGGGWGVSRHQTLGCKISPQLCSSAVHTCETQEAGCSEHAVFKCFYSHALLDCVGCGGDSQSQVSNSCHLRHLGWGG